MVNFMELSTILVEIEGVVNSSPLTYVYDDAEGISFPLTPSHLLNGRNLLQETLSMRHKLPLSFYQADTSTKLHKVLRSRQ